MASNLASELSGTQMVEFVARLGRFGVSPEVAKKLMGDDEAMKEFVYKGLGSPESLDRITVPNLLAGRLVALAKQKLRFYNFDGVIAGWDFVRDECGKTYEVQVWKPGREVVPATEARERFVDGFVGNTAAFVAWVTKHNPEGYYATIPADDRLFRRGSCLYAPRLSHIQGFHYLDLDFDVYDRWCFDCAFVAFRELKSA